MSGEVFDTEGNLIEVAQFDADPFDMLGTPQFDGSQFAEAMTTISSTGSQLSDQARRVLELFDGTKTVTIGAAQAPIGLVLGAGVLALFAYHHHTKGGR